jgi:hypothetical protein
MSKFHETKIIILASVVLTACLLLNFAVARQNIGLMSLLAQTDYDLLNVRFIAISMTLSGFVFSSITVIFWQRRMFIPALICGFFTVGIFIYECHGVIAAFSELNAKYEENSDTSKLEKMRIELAEKKLTALEVGKVDAGDAESRLAELQQQVLNKEAKAAKCKIFQFECKNKALAGADKLAAEIDSIHNQMNHQAEYVTALSEAQSEIKASDSSENKKTFAVFQTLSRFFYDTIDYAKNLQSKLLVYMSILIVLLAQSSLAIALLLLPKHVFGGDDTSDNPQYKKRFLNLVDTAKNHFKQDSQHGSAATRTEPGMTFLRTGTDNEPFEMATEQKRGFGEVLNFPNRNVTTATKHGSPALQPKNESPNAPVMDDSKHATITHLLNVPVMVADKEPIKQVASALQPVKTVIKQATMGRLICEHCNKDVMRKTHNQRFCCEDCRVKAWELKHGKSFRKGRALK